MNKTLIAMAVAGVMAAPMAAQADATIYGKLHVSIDMGDTGGEDGTGANADNKASGTYWQSNSSRLGFKGSEDLGGGLKAKWQIESAIGIGSSSSSLAARNTWVGLAGGWGEIRGGKHDTMFKTVGRKFDLFGDQVGDSRNLIRLDRVVLPSDATVQADYDRRANNVVAYLSPTFGGGFSVQVGYVIDDATQDSNIVTASAYWKSGNWMAALGYEGQDKGLNPGGEDSSGLRAGLQWKPGAWKLNLFYQSISDAAGYSGADGDVLGLGAGYKMGKNVLKAQYFVTDNEGDENDATLIAVGWDYNFSKRTTAYLAYSTTDNDANVYYATDRGGHGGEIYGQAAGTTTVNGDDPSAISLGMIHKF